MSANEAGDGAALRIQTLLPVARRGYGTVWIDCGELWTLPRVPQPPKARGGAAIAWHAHLDLRETRNLDLRINWMPLDFVFLPRSRVPGELLLLTSSLKRC